MGISIAHGKSRLLKLECLKSKLNRRSEDVAGDDETAARSLPCLRRTSKTTNAMTRLVAPFPYHQMTHPPSHHQNNTIKSRIKTTIRKKQRSGKANKTIKKANRPSLWKNSRDTLHWIAKWWA